MTDFFFDSSALVKRYMREKGSNWVVNTTNSPLNRVLIAEITQVELVSAVMRQARENKITSRTAQATYLLINRHMRGYYVIGFTPAIIQRAQDLLIRHPLRAYDAVQLATALEINALLVSSQSTPIIFVSNDQRLLTVAIAEKLSTDDPNLHP